MSFRLSFPLLTVALAACAVVPGAARAQAPAACIPETGSCALIEQAGSFQHADVTQAGLGNAAVVRQAGVALAAPAFDAAGNHVTLDQTDGGNTATILQAPLPGVGSDDNVVLLVQDGGGSAEIVQEGAYNRVAGPGDGFLGAVDGSSLDGSALVVYQSGQNNALYLDQQNGATALVYQSGTGNVATVVQH